MLNRIFPVCTILLVLSWFSTTTQGQDLLTPSFPTDDFAKKIRPLLAKYCANCHAPGEMEGLEFLIPDSIDQVKEHRSLFADVVEQLETGAMPPGDDQPSDLERKEIVSWFKRTLELKPADTERIAQYVVNSFQDSKGNLWFGTMSRGVARYDGKQLVYFNLDDGLPSLAAPSFAEDKTGTLWVGTQNGVCRFDGQRFARLGPEVGFPARSQSSPQATGRVFATRAGEIWICLGTKVYRMVKGKPVLFRLPNEMQKPDSFAILRGAAAIKLEDRQGNLWFAVDGYGVYRYDGRSFKRFTKSDGLCSNNVTGIIEDQDGNLWFTCMQSYQPKMTGDGGLCRFDGKTFDTFATIKGLANNDLYTVFATRLGKIWIGASGVGAYRYDGQSFELFSQTDQPHRTRNFGLQSIMEDREGTLWFGFSGGLFRFNGSSFYNVTPAGPWKSLPAAMRELLLEPGAEEDWIRTETRQSLKSLRDGSLDQAVAEMKEIQRRWPNEISIQEVKLNQLGYELVASRQLDLATRVFELNTKLYPTAFNTFDSLGENYLYRGNEPLALKNFRKSIELNPDNENGKLAIRKIEAAQEYRDMLVAPEGWLEEVIECPPRFAPTMSIKGLEHLRLPPEFRDPESERFMSYLFAIELAEPIDLDQQQIQQQLLLYFRGLASGGRDQQGQPIDTSKFRIAAVSPHQPLAEDEYQFLMTWQEPFAKGTHLKQNLRVKVMTRTKADRNKIQVLFVCGSPQPETSEVWRQLLETRGQFEQRWRE